MILLLLCLLQQTPPSAGAATLSADHKSIMIDVDASLRKLSTEKLAQILTVRIGTGAQKEIAARSPIPGTVILETTSGQTSLKFVPRFPLTPGVPYQVLFSPAIIDGTSPSKSTTLTVPKPKPTASVTAVYPTEEKLPENLLRFYIHFSKPMSKGEAYNRIHLLDKNGKELQYPFLELAEELWSDDRQRFTLLLDPGRVKRHLMPRETEGAILESGNKYTLVIDQSWQDRDGVPMTKTFRKTFTATPARLLAIDPEKWTLQLPKGKEPFSVRFNQSVDHALASRMMWVVDAKGKKLYGQISDDEPLLWKLDTALKPGPYQLVIDTRLEDPCGNRIGQAFEVDLLEPIPERTTVKTVSIPFTVPK